MRAGVSAVIEQFYASLNATNRKVRNGQLSLSDRIVRDLSAKERAHMHRLIRRAQQLLAPCPRMRRIPFRVFFFRDAESHYPHTHSDTIFLPYPKFLLMPHTSQLEILIHEHIHVYQRTCPIPFHKYLFEMMGVRVTRLMSSHPDYPTVRRNPDMNDVLYVNPKGEYRLTRFVKNATSLADVDTWVYRSDQNQSRIRDASGPLEHPFEESAYDLSRRLVTGTYDPAVAARYL